MLDRGLEHLRPGGRVVITAPFGVHPRQDNRRTFYLTDLIGLLKPRLGLGARLAVEDNYIRFVGRLSEVPCQRYILAAVWILRRSCP